MFEHIYFFTHQTDGENQDVLKDEAYQKMVKMYHLPSAKDTSFCIDGKSRYLLQQSTVPGKAKILKCIYSLFLIWTLELLTIRNAVITHPFCYCIPMRE